MYHHYLHVLNCKVFCYTILLCWTLKGFRKVWMILKKCPHIGGSLLAEMSLLYSDDQNQAGQSQIQLKALYLS